MIKRTENISISQKWFVIILRKNIYLLFAETPRILIRQAGLTNCVRSRQSPIEPSEYQFKFDEMILQAERSVCFGIKRSTGECKGYHLYGARKYSIAVILLTAILNKTMKQTIEGQGKTPSMFSKKNFRSTKKSVRHTWIFHNLKTSDNS